MQTADRWVSCSARANRLKLTRHGVRHHSSPAATGASASAWVAYSERDRPGNSIRSLGITADRDLLERKRGGFVSDNHLGIARGRKACSVLSVNADPATQVAVECIT